MKEIVIKQYITAVRTVAVMVDDDDDSNYAAEVLDGMPLKAEQMPADTARVISDWDYVQDSDDFEDEDGNSVCP